MCDEYPPEPIDLWMKNHDNINDRLRVFCDNCKHLRYFTWNEQEWVCLSCKEPK